MNEKEIAEIRRRLKPNKNNITHICGCYVNDNKEIVSEFDQSPDTVSDEEREEILAVLRKTLTGTAGRNLIEISFSNNQVTDGAEHKLLSELRKSRLKSKEAAKIFYEKIISSLNFEGSYIIMLAHDSYDVFAFSGDGSKEEDSSEVYSYIVCCVCPIKASKSVLSYHVFENKFSNIASDATLAAPITGFLFPAFDDRKTNIYNALYYTKSADDIHKEFTDVVFNTEVPMCANDQKKAFGEILVETVGTDYKFDVAQTIYDKLWDIVAEHKPSERLVINSEIISEQLKKCEVREEVIEKFCLKYDETFGKNAELNPKNLINTKKFDLGTPDVAIHVNPERSDLVKTRTIDGVKYIMVRAEGGVEVSGVSINIADKVPESV